MPSSLKELKEQVSRLPEADLQRFAEWFARMREKRSYEKRCDTTSGIPYKDLLKIFKKRNGNIPWVPWASMAASAMLKFYEAVRIQGCDPNDGDDGLMIEWGPAPEGEFKLAYVREVGPPRPPGRDEEVWHLTIALWFPLTSELERMKSGGKAFPTLREIERNFYSFALKSKLGTVTRKLKPSRVTVTYENVE